MINQSLLGLANGNVGTCCAIPGYVSNRTGIALSLRTSEPTDFNLEDNDTGISTEKYIIRILISIGG